MAWEYSCHVRLHHFEVNTYFKTGNILALEKKTVNDEEVILKFLLGDPAYPLLAFLMKECANNGSAPQEQYFRLCPCRAQMVIECAFGQL